MPGESLFPLLLVCVCCMLCVVCGVYVCARKRMYRKVVVALLRSWFTHGKSIQLGFWVQLGLLLSPTGMPKPETMADKKVRLAFPTADFAGDCYLRCVIFPAFLEAVCQLCPSLFQWESGLRFSGKLGAACRRAIETDPCSLVDTRSDKIQEAAFSAQLAEVDGAAACEWEVSTKKLHEFPVGSNC